MAPILLDRHHIQTLVILFVISILLFFVGGYVLGYQQAMKKAISDSLVSELPIPIVESAQTSAVGEYSTSNEPGEDVDVDKPDAVNKPVRSALKSDIPVAKKELNNKKRTTGGVLSTKSDLPKVTKIEVTETEVLNNEFIKIIDNANEADAKFSIQVGLYGIRVNAQRRVDELIKKQLSGHLTNFVNEKGDVLFNVRFGYFLDKDSVNEALKTYQQKYTGDGYIIKLKRKAKI